MRSVSNIQKLNKKGQIVISKNLRDQLNISSNSMLSIKTQNNQIIIDIINDPILELQNMFKDKLPSAQQMKEEIRADEKKHIK